MPRPPEPAPPPRLVGTWGHSTADPAVNSSINGQEIVGLSIEGSAAFGDSFFLNVESFVGFFPYALYYGAYSTNRHLGGVDTPGVNGALSWLQRIALHADEAFDRFQQWSGYLGATKRDERIPVSPIPSVIFPVLGRNRNWYQGKWVQPWIRTQGPGLGPNGQEDYWD